MQQNKKNGFTLVELMVTVAIIGILASIAYPSYQDSVIKSRRTDAQSGLMKFSTLMVRQQTETGKFSDLPSSDYPGSTDYYDFSASGVTATAFTLLATPKGGQTADSCGTLKLTHTDEKISTGTGSRCW